MGTFGSCPGRVDAVRQQSSATITAFSGEWEASDFGADTDERCSSSGASCSTRSSFCSTACSSRRSSLDCGTSLNLPNLPSLSRPIPDTVSPRKAAGSTRACPATSTSPHDASVVPPEAAHFLARLNQPYKEQPMAAGCPASAALRWAASLDERREHHLRQLRRQLSAVLRRVEPRTRVVGFAPSPSPHAAVGEAAGPRGREPVDELLRPQTEGRGLEQGLSGVRGPAAGGWAAAASPGGVAGWSQMSVARTPSRLSLLLGQQS